VHTVMRHEIMEHEAPIEHSYAASYVL